MICTDSVMNSKLLCLVIFVIVSQLIKASLSLSISLWDGSDFGFTGKVWEVKVLGRLGIF